MRSVITSGLNLTLVISLVLINRLGENEKTVDYRMKLATQLVVNKKRHSA